MPPLLALAVALSTGAVPVAGAASGPGAVAPPSLRLPRSVQPLRGALELTVDPERPAFSGIARYRVLAREPVRTVWLHAEGLTVIAAAVGGRPASPVAAPGGFLGLTPDGPVPAGETDLEIAFAGEIDRTRSRGLYAAAEGGRWYAYTFFEPIDARRAFPCFDEPWAKIPWQVTLRVPAGDVALGNAPVARETTQGAWRRVELAETRPLPSYLVAFVVGPFDVIPAGAGGAARVPVRFVVPRGRGSETAFAAGVTPRILDALEATIGLPYPYEKCDVAVVPRYWGTMEHPGIVALGQPLTLIRPEDDSRERREHYATIAVHELAHHWYGDLVTMAWWDDTWLNESFGTWDEANATERLEPAWRAADGRRWGQRAAAFASDVLPSAKRLREPVASDQEIEDAFDAAITYHKGASVLRMLEAWLGPESFRGVVRSHLRSHADGIATTPDLLATLSSAAGHGLAAAARGFVEQAGVPLLRASRACDARGARVVIRQSRFLATGRAGDDARWTVPVCLRSGAAGRVATTCALAAGPVAEIPLPACPEWIWPNAGGTGYHLSLVEGVAPLGLLPHLSPPERLALATDASLLARRGDLPVGRALALVAPLARSGDRLQVEASVDLAGLVDPDHLEDRDRPGWRSFVRRTWGSRAAALGWSPGPGELEESRALRSRLLPFVADQGEDPALLAGARAVAEGFLSHVPAAAGAGAGASPPPDVAWAALGVAARRGDAAFFEAIDAAARRSPDPTERRRLVALLGRFEDAALARRALAAAVAPDVDLRDTLPVLEAALGGRRTRGTAFAFLQKRWDDLLPRLRSDEAARLLATAASGACDRPARYAAAAALGPRAATVPGAVPALRVALDAADACIEARARNARAIRAFLAVR